MYTKFVFIDPLNLCKVYYSFQERVPVVKNAYVI